MYRLIIKICLCLLGSVVCKSMCAQNITIKSASLQPNDRTAIEHPCLDLNGDTCVLLKIKTDNLEGIEFSNPNQYIKKSYEDGVYYVYVPTISRKLDLLHKDYMPFQIDLANYGYKKLRAGKTYLIVLDAPRNADLQSSVIIKVEPKQSQIIFDDQTYEANQSGTFKFSIASGRHLYEVSAPNYHSQKGTVIIGKSEAKTVSVRLQPITHEVTISCNVQNARVVVDNIDYGNVGKLVIPQGERTIRVQADGYVDSEKKVQVNEATGSLSFELEENFIGIHATPVKIYANSSRIYKNNKEIKGWKNGATIMFMPGKYELSDYMGNTKIITVKKDEPMTVTL